MKMRVSRALPYAGVVAVVVLAGVSGWALAASTPNVIHACSTARTGALRLAKKCSKHERAVTWNVQGPKGETGATGGAGAKGETGNTGAPGPSDIYAAGASSGALTSSYTQVASITVPQGSYLIQAETTIFAGSVGAPVKATCQIAPTVAGGPGTWDQASAAVPGVSSKSSDGVISLAGADTFSAQQTIVLSCLTQAGSNTFDDARLWATKTGSLHATLPIPID